MKINLEECSIWYDGTVELTPKQLEHWIVNQRDLTNVLIADTLEVSQLEHNSILKFKHHKTKNDALDLEWIIPIEYKELDIDKYIDTVTNQLTDINRKARVSLERKLFAYYQLDDVLRTIIYVLDVFQQNNVIWGVGRGSSCASYLLYLIGLHNVDSVKYDIPIEEFFKVIPEELTHV